ncbi:hypothetical protein [Intestinibacter sp.]|uniref:hypothetical protein n=1 Tax=Intestinibacter sp. TaxID=1965304 RepID=UPI002A913EC0|nr:hypothetical protein [Intestinibacter sp.]MDY5211983.1 hypothetical protein [Intestinibacter sp.]
MRDFENNIYRGITMDFEKLNESVERLIQNLEFIKSLEEEGIPMSDDNRDMILRNIDSITNLADNDYKSGLFFDIR